MILLERFIEKLKLKAVDIVDYAEPNIPITGLFGTVGYPLFYLVWKYILPQPYESLDLRLMEAVITLPWVFYRFLPKKMKDFFTVYFFFSLFFLIPFFFCFMLLKNEWSTVWAMSTMAGLFLLIILVYDWLLISVMTVAAYGLAHATVLLLDGKVLYTHISWSYLPLFLFAFFGSMIMNHRKKVAHESKLSLVKSLSGTIAHEMRNPLSSITYAMETVQSILPGKPQAGIAESRTFDLSYAGLLSIHDVIEESSETVRRGNKIIDSILASLQGGEVDRRYFKRYAAKEIIHTAIETYGYSDPEEKKLIFIGTSRNFEFLGDKDLFIYVLFNLQKNALFYRHKPGFRIEITTEVLEGANRIIFKDTGPGIPANKREKIFELFYTSGKPGGNGIGLSFCRRVVESFGGSIVCDSVENAWTEFVITLPHYDSKPVERIKKQILSHKHVLVADDQEINRILPSKYLTEWNCRVDLAENGRQALEMASSTRYDMILMDIEMPYVNGDEAVRRLRSGFNVEPALVQHYREVPIIGVTALPEEEARQRTILVGMNSYVLKPFRRTDLTTLFDQYFFAEKVRSDSASHESISGARILLVDDNVTSRKFMSVVLENLGCRTAQAEHGKHAIELLDQEEFDLVLMDMEMPVMGGIEATRIIRKGECFRRFTGYRNIPIIALTGNSDEKTVKRVKDIGMNDHLGKPVSKHDLIRTMSAWLRQSHPEEPPLVQEALRTSVVKINLMSVDPWKDIENENILGLSVITSLKDIGGNELIAQLFELFLLDAGKIIDELSAAFEKRDIDLADQASHTLKGSAASVGAYKMHVLAKYVNDVIRTGQWPDHEGWADYVRLVYRETSTAFSAYLNTAETVTPVP
jgi:two-component system CAI-1 autoinducer sensor kinase/phosphatase CqsS